MILPAPMLFLFAAFTVAESRVAFTSSEVLQATDITAGPASFSCGQGCKVYVDRKDDYLQITQNGRLIATFTEIIGNNSFIPDGIVLPAANNYVLQTTRSPIKDFVFYCVSVKAPNYGVSVGAPQSSAGITANGQGRYFTVLSSFNALQFAGFSGSFPSGYPRIYATGFDSVKDTRCSPVYQARSQKSAEQSQPRIFTPIMTIDFGFDGSHSVTVTSNDASKPPLTTSVASTVYMSPGYVGCTLSGNPQYYSPVRSISDKYSLSLANSLNIYAIYNVAYSEPVRFTVNRDVLDFSGTNNFTRSYGYGSYDVSMSWTRLTSTSSWVLQLDYTNGRGAVSMFIASFIVLLFASV